MVVHSSHAMTTHAGLKLHFCTCCGSYGSFRSNYLKEPCVEALRFSGRHALRPKSLDKHPGTFLKAHLQRRGPKKSLDKENLGGGGIVDGLNLVRKDLFSSIREVGVEMDIMMDNAGIG